MWLILQTKSPICGITWLEGFWISSTYDQDTAYQSCQSNLDSPCILVRVLQTSIHESCLRVKSTYLTSPQSCPYLTPISIQPRKLLQSIPSVCRLSLLYMDFAFKCLPYSAWADKKKVECQNQIKIRSAVRSDTLYFGLSNGALVV